MRTYIENAVAEWVEEDLTLQPPEKLDAIKSIYKAAFPFYLQTDIDDVGDWQDLARHLAVPLDDMSIMSNGKTWYVVIHFESYDRAHIVSIAKRPGSPIIDWLGLLEFLRRRGVRRVYADMRKRTTYKKLKKYGPLLGITVVRENDYMVGPEAFYEVEMDIDGLRVGTAREIMSRYEAAGSAVQRARQTLQRLPLVGKYI